MFVVATDSPESPPHDTQTDDTWIKQALDGNSEAFGNIVLKYQPRFIAMAMRILHSEAEAEDAVGEAFIEAFRHLPDFQNRSKFSTWLYTIMINHVRNRLRHNRVLQWVPLETPAHEDGELNFMNFAENTPEMEEALDHKLQLEQIHEILGSFPPLYRTIFSLHYFRGIPLHEVAQEISRPIGTVKVYLHRARKLLDKHLEKIGAH